jgi:hypothetical protein
MDQAARRRLGVGWNLVRHRYEKVVTQNVGALIPVLAFSQLHFYIFT